MLDPTEYLRRAHQQGILVPFVGAGLGVSAANLPSWPVLLEEGIEYVKTSLHLDASAASLVKISELAAESHFVEAFSELAKVMSGDPDNPDNLLWESFIAEQFSDPTIVNSELLDALSYLNCPRIVTTNYDRLLEMWQAIPSKSLTWQDAAGIRDAFRLGSGVVHLHGVWDRPESIVLSRNSYESISADESARHIARVIFHGSVLMFIGTSLDGTHDPHLGDLLSEFESLADRKQGVSNPHIMLVRGRVNGKMRAKWLRQGIEPVSYGDEYDDLPKFLRSIPEDKMASVDSYTLSKVFRAVVSSETLDSALLNIAGWIEKEIFVGRKIRISFAEKVADGRESWQVQRRAPLNGMQTSSPHNYPLSISAWSMIEANPIEWPRNSGKGVELGWIKRCNKYELIDTLIKRPELDSVPELARYIDVGNVRKRWDDGSLTYGDFFQDWASDQLSPPYKQFVTVPVPWLDAVPTREIPLEFGVYNIDTLESIPLINHHTKSLLRLASDMTELAFLLHRTEEH